MIVKNLTEKLNKIKICAVFTAACFMISTLGTNLYATSMAENITQKYEDIFNKATCISNEYGKITSSKDAQSDITVINIQDLHCHPQTQRNISKIIKEIESKYNLKKIYVEGGYGNIDVSWLNSIKDENIRKQAIEKLLEEGILTGSEYYKLTNNNNIELKGIDEEDIHKDNVKRLSWLITQQAKYKKIIEKITKEINILEKIYVNGRNERFNKNIEDYLSNKINSKKFYKQLIKYVKDINNNPYKYNNITAIRLEDYPNINKFLSMATYSHKINVKKVKTELQGLLILLKNRLPFSVYSKLLKETNNFTDNQKSLELINLLCKKENIDLNKDFKEIIKLSELNFNNKSFNPIQLVQEERQLISEIRKALSYNIEEYEITFISDFNKYFQDYLEYNLNDTDWKYFDSYYKQFRQIYSKYAVIDRIKEIENNFSEINKYYKINDQRNNIFVKNLLKNEDITLINFNKERTEDEILKNSKEIIIAVTGGFHSSQLEELLYKKEVNTIIITPTIFESTKQANIKYVDLIEKQSKINSQALAYTIASCIKDVDKQKLLLTIVKDIIGNNTDKLQEILGNKINLDLIENIEPLTQKEQKQLEQIKKDIEIVSDILIDLLPKEGGKNIFIPNINKVILNISKDLVKMRIFLSTGPIFEAEEEGLPNLNGISAEEYSRMHTIIQKALLKTYKSNTKENGYTPQLTMTFLKNILDKTSLKRNTKIKIISIIEAPIIMLGLIFPSVNNWFLKQHKIKNIEDKILITSELDTLNDNIKNTYFDSFVKIKEIIKIPFVRTIAAFSISIIKAFKVNIKEHSEFNTTAYLIQSFKDLNDFDVKYKDLFKYTNFTTKQEKQILRLVLNLKDKLNMNPQLKNYTEEEITMFIKVFMSYEILYFQKNKKFLYINSIINNLSDLEIIHYLLKDLIKANIYNIETEYNMLALKIFESKNFRDLINKSNIEYGSQSLSQKYFIAIAIARYINKVLNGAPINSQNFDEIVKVATETYIKIIENNENKIVIDENTKIIAISAQSDDIQQFNNNGIKKLLQKLNISENGENRIFLSSDMESVPAMKQRFLDMIANLNANDKQVFISFDGHGFERTLILNSFVNITNEELFNALKKAQEKGFDLNNLTINLSSCESWFFANSIYNKFDNFYKNLEKKNKLKSKNYPTIWTAAGHETIYGYTDKYYSLSTPLFDDKGEINTNVDFNTIQVGNEWNAVLLMLTYGQQTSLKIKDILKATIEAKKANFTLFISDENIEPLCNESAKKILELNFYNNIIKEELQSKKGLKYHVNKLFNLLIKINNLSFLQSNTINNKELNFNKGYFELSIFSELKNKSKLFDLLHNTAYIWEEIIFRFTPICLSIVAISVPAISFVTVPMSLIFFIISQNQFIKAHNIINWIVENKINWSTKDIFKATLLNKFSSKELKEQFKQFEKQRQIKEQNKQIFLPTILLSVPYIYSMLFVPNIPALILATVIGIIIHKFFNSILKYKLSIFENQTNNIDLSTNEGKQEFFSLLIDSKTNINDVINKIDFNNEQQLSDLIQIISNNYLYLNKSLETFITGLSKKINVNNDKELDFLRNILDASMINKENIIYDLISKLNFNNPNHFEFIKHFILNKSIQTIDINYKLIDKLNFDNKEHLNLITSLSRFSDDIIFKLIEKLNFNDKEQVSVISGLIINIGFSNTKYIINEILAKLNLNNKKDLVVFETIVCNYKFRTEENFEQIINMLDLSKPEHIKTLEKILNKEYFKIVPTFNILLKHLNFDNSEHLNLFKTALDKIITIVDKEITVNNIFKQTIDSLVVETKSDLNFLIYTRNKFLDTLLKKIIRLRTENIIIKNGLATIHLQNQTKLDSIKITSLKIKESMDLSDTESIKKLNELLRNIELFENMQQGKTTIDEFAQETGFSLLKPTPTTYLDGKRTVFTSILKLLPKSLYDIKQHDITFVMSKSLTDRAQLKEVSAKFNAYMKLLDENLYVLNKFNDLTNFSSQFDDVVKHINIMLDYLAVISESDANIFRRILERIVEDIHNGSTDITEQKVLVEMVDNPFSNINTINTLINRIHQKASFDFLAKASSHIGKNSVIEHNIYLSKGSKTIGVYNLSETKIHPDIKKLLIALNDDPDFSTDKNSNIFIKDNILLWTGLLGAHAVRVVIDFSEDSRSILADFHEGMIDEGSYVRIRMLKKIMSDIGFTIEDSAQQYQKYDRLVGIVATLNKDTGLKNDSTFIELTQKLMVLFNNAAAFNNSIKKPSQMKQTIKVSVLRIMEIYSKMFYVGRLKNNYIYSTSNTRKNLNKILSFLNLPLIPKKEEGFKTNLKIGPFFAGRITTYGQNTIDKYINKPIERAFALGYIKLNENGDLEKNNDYNLLSSTIETLKKLSDSPIGNPQEIEMLKQGSILSQIPIRDLNFKTYGQIGDYVLKTGYIKLVDGRLNNITGEFIGFYVLVDKNGIIRYSTSELVGLPEKMNNLSGRMLLTSEQLQQLFETEGYDIEPNESLTDQELYNYRNKLQQNVFNTITPIAYGLTLSKPKKITTRGIFATIGSDVYIDKYASPENVGISAQNKVSLFTGGSYSSHAGIVLREYGKSALIVNDSQITKNGMKIKFYIPKGDVKITDNFKTQEIEENEITLEQNDIVIIDHQNNKLLLFPNKIFKNSKGANILFELQEYIDKKDGENIHNFINRYKNNSELTKRIIEYIYYQSYDNFWLEEFLTPELKSNKKIVKVSEHSRVIEKNKLVIQQFLSHKSSNNVYIFGEKESLDVTKVGTKSANQSKLFLILEQLKKDTGIENVAVPNGMVISYNILETLLGEEYIELYKQLESIIKNDFFNDEEKFIYVQDITEQIKDLIQNIPEEDIIKYIGKENLEIFKDKLTIIRSSGVGEDSKEYSAAGIAESFGQVEYKNIPKAVKDTLLSFFSYRAIDYMTKSANIIKPAVLIEEWIDADKAGIMMSEDNDGNRIIQIINGQGEDIVSGRITPYSFTIDIETGKKIDGNYTNEQTVTKNNLENLTKIMEWLEQIEGVPVDIEFLIKNNIIYIVQVRPITTINKIENTIPVLSQKTQLITKKDNNKKLSIFENFKENEKQIFKILDFTSSVWEEILFRTIPSVISLAVIALPLNIFITIPLGIIIFTLPQIQFIKAHIITDWLKTKDSGWLKNLSTKEIIKTSIFGLFPSRELKNEFIKYSQTDKAKQHKKVLILPTIFLSSIYVVSSIFITNHMLATVLVVIIHLINNSNIELFGILKPININTKIKETGIDNNFVSLAKNNNADFISIYDLIPKIKLLKQQNKHEAIPVRRYINPIHLHYWNQQQKFVADSVGFSLGLTTVNIFDNNKVNFIQPISESNNLISWERGYDYFYGNTYIDERVVPVEEYVQTIIDSCIKYNKHIFFFLPNNFMDSDTKTKREFDYIQKLLTTKPELSNYFTFVVGVYDFIDIQQESVFNKFFNKKNIASTLKKLLSAPNLFMKRNLRIISNITNIGIMKFTKNIFRLSFDSILKTIRILTLIKFSKQQNITQNTEAVKRLKKDIKENNKRQVCFICTANINRSAIAHLLFEDKLLKSGVTNVNVVSAGLLPISQKNKDTDLSLVQSYKKLLEQFNVNQNLIDNFRSEEISKKHINSDYFIVVSQKHKNFLTENFGIDSNKIILYSDIDPELKNGFLPDPQLFEISKIDMIKLIKNIFYYLFNVIFEEDVKNFNDIIFILKKHSNLTKTFVVEYKFIEASEIENLAENIKLNNDKNIEQIYITDNIEKLKDRFLLINTGIKIDGTSIYRVKIGNLLIYGAKNKPGLKIIKLLNESEKIKEEIKSLFSIKDEIEVEGFIITNSNGININESILEIGESELTDKTPQQIKEFITSALEVKKILGIMYSQKTIIDLKKLAGQELIKAVENGIARKVITENQYIDLQLSKEKISQLKEKGIEVYVECNEIKEEYRQNGISGQIIRENEKPYIYDYYSTDKTELNEIKNQTELANLEEQLLNSDKLILVDIKLLKKKFQVSNPIEAFTKLGALTGKIKITIGLGNINIKDIENVGYNISFDEIPEMNQINIQQLLKATSKEEIINVIGQQNEFAVILTNLKSENINRFKELIIERILTKKALTESATALNGIELEDKKLEILLGKLLFRQMNYTDKEKIKEELVSQGQLMKILEDLKKLDNNQKGIESEEQKILVNTIIQLILLYDGQRIKGNQIQKQTDLGNISNYRAMLAAA